MTTKPSQVQCQISVVGWLGGAATTTAEIPLANGLNIGDTEEFHLCCEHTIPHTTAQSSKNMAFYFSIQEPSGGVSLTRPSTREVSSSFADDVACLA